MARLRLAALALAGLVLAGAARADDQRAHINYMLHCQGCHLPEAQGFGEKVPRINGFLGYFLHSEEGRQFIVRVPGVATARLPDSEIAELMNWLLVTYSPEQLPEGFEPFTENEIRELRQEPEAEPLVTRMSILRAIADDVPALAAELQNY